MDRGLKDWFLGCAGKAVEGGGCRIGDENVVNDQIFRVSRKQYWWLKELNLKVKKKSSPFSKNNEMLKYQNLCMQNSTLNYTW